jgi:glutamyl-tRNA synthetase
MSSGSIAKYIGNELSILKQGAQIIHWVPKSANHPAIIHHPDRGQIQGYCEVGTENALGKMIQFERFGFVKLGNTKEPAIEGWFAHK